MKAPKFVSGMCLAIFWSSEGATAHKPSAPRFGGKLSAIVKPSAKEIEHAAIPGRQLARSTYSFALCFASRSEVFAAAAGADSAFPSLASVVAGLGDAGFFSSFPSIVAGAVDSAFFYASVVAGGVNPGLSQITELVIR